jgi:hypothetical protein
MRNRIQINELNITDNQRFNTYINLGGTSIDLVENNPLSEILANEGNENFVNYVSWLGLDKDPDLVVLSSMHHYFYGAEEMKKVKTVVNLKELNQIKHLRDFLHSIFSALPSKCNFIGCFTDNSKQNNLGLNLNSSDYEAIENGIVSRNPFLNMIYNIMDSRTYKTMSRKSVRISLEDHGFKVIDMTELNGLTFFFAQKVRTTRN